MSDLYFDLTILLENIAKNYGVPNANYYFRIYRIKPTKEEYRKKVVEFMKHYEHTLNTFSDTPNYIALKSFVDSMMGRMIEEVLSGKNKEVEKRYRYYVMNPL